MSKEKKDEKKETHQQDVVIKTIFKWRRKRRKIKKIKKIKACCYLLNIKNNVYNSLKEASLVMAKPMAQMVREGFLKNFIKENDKLGKNYKSLVVKMKKEEYERLEAFSKFFEISKKKILFYHGVPRENQKINKEILLEKRNGFEIKK
jgi:hypothetical protein